LAARTKLAHKAGGIYAGCSGWSYSSWKPEFYPAGLSSKKFLAYYATQLNSVEVNYTFREVPSESAVDTWLAATGDAFRFSFKAPQRITHMLRLKKCGEVLREFVQSIAPVTNAGRTGLILFQLPPNMQVHAKVLRAFLDDAHSSGASLRMAFEFRHPSWFAEEAYSTLAAHGAALCVAESDELTTPDVKTASFACYRLRKSNYSAAGITRIRKTLRERAAQGDVFAYFKHEDEPTGAMRAMAVLRGMKQP
jgi:uncharacterized protein YecE (DUF72 family)